jgi:hypothetical protein
MIRTTSVSGYVRLQPLNSAATVRGTVTATSELSALRCASVSRGIVLWPDDNASHLIRTVWDEIASQGLPSMATHTHRLHKPHVSLTVAEYMPVRAALEAAQPLPSQPIQTPGRVRRVCSRASRRFGPSPRTVPGGAAFCSWRVSRTADYSRSNDEFTVQSGPWRSNRGRTSTPGHGLPTSPADGASRLSSSPGRCQSSWTGSRSRDGSKEAVSKTAARASTGLRQKDSPQSFDGRPARGPGLPCQRDRCDS